MGLTHCLTHCAIHGTAHGPIHGGKGREGKGREMGHPSMTVTGPRATRSATFRPCLLAVMDGCFASRFEAMV